MIDRTQPLTLSVIQAFGDRVRDAAGNGLINPSSASSYPFPLIYIDTTPTSRNGPSSVQETCGATFITPQGAVIQEGIHNSTTHNQMDFKIYLTEPVALTTPNSIGLDLLPDPSGTATHQAVYQSHAMTDTEWTINFRYTVTSSSAKAFFRRESQSTSSNNAAYRFDFKDDSSIKDTDTYVGIQDFVHYPDRDVFCTDFTINPDAPGITSVTVADGTYDPTANPNLNFTMTYHGGTSVDVYTNSANNTPYIEFKAGGVVKQAHYVSGSGTAVHTYGYTVTGSDADAAGIAIEKAAIKLNGGKINSDLQADGTADGDNAVLRFTAPANLGSVIISDGNRNN